MWQDNSRCTGEIVAEPLTTKRRKLGEACNTVGTVWDRILKERERKVNHSYERYYHATMPSFVLPYHDHAAPTRSSVAAGTDVEQYRPEPPIEDVAFKSIGSGKTKEIHAEFEAGIFPSFTVFSTDTDPRWDEILQCEIVKLRGKVSEEKDKERIKQMTDKIAECSQDKTDLEDCLIQILGCRFVQPLEATLEALRNICGQGSEVSDVKTQRRIDAIAKAWSSVTYNQNVALWQRLFTNLSSSAAKEFQTHSNTSDWTGIDYAYVALNRRSQGRRTWDRGTLRQASCNALLWFMQRTFQLSVLSLGSAQSEFILGRFATELAVGALRFLRFVRIEHGTLQYAGWMLMLDLGFDVKTFSDQGLAFNAPHSKHCVRLAPETDLIDASTMARGIRHSSEAFVFLQKFCPISSRLIEDEVVTVSELLSHSHHLLSHILMARTETGEKIPHCCGPALEGITMNDWHQARDSFLANQGGKPFTRLLIHVVRQLRILLVTWINAGVDSRDAERGSWESVVKRTVSSYMYMTTETLKLLEQYRGTTAMEGSSLLTKAAESDMGLVKDAYKKFSEKQCATKKS
eukprot:Clim_evm51s214 gene=Clim_evmTU51s214